MKDYEKHERERFSYMTPRQLRTRLNKITDREKLWWFSKIAEEKAISSVNYSSWFRTELEDLAALAMKKYKQSCIEEKMFLDPKLFEWEDK